MQDLPDLLRRRRWRAVHVLVLLRFARTVDFDHLSRIVGVQPVVHVALASRVPPLRGLAHLNGRTIRFFERRILCVSAIAFSPLAFSSRFLKLFMRLSLLLPALLRSELRFVFLSLLLRLLALPSSSIRSSFCFASFLFLLILCALLSCVQKLSLFLKHFVCSALSSSLFRDRLFLLNLFLGRRIFIRTRNLARCRYLLLLVLLRGDSSGYNVCKCIFLLVSLIDLFSLLKNILLFF